MITGRGMTKVMKVIKVMKVTSVRRAGEINKCFALLVVFAEIE